MNLLPARAEISCPLSILERVRIKEVFFTGNVLTGASYAQEQFEIYCERKNTEPASFKIIIFFFFFLSYLLLKEPGILGNSGVKFLGFRPFFACAENPGKIPGKTRVSRLSWFCRNLEKPKNAKRKFSTLSVWKREENIFHAFKAYRHMCKKAWSCSQGVSCSPS